MPIGGSCRAVSAGRGNGDLLRGQREKQAWDDLREGRVESALTWMAEQDRVRIYDTRPQLLAGIVDAWWAGDRDGLMVTDTSNAERDALNELAQARRRGAGELGEEALELVGGQRVHAGDRVLFNAIHRPAGRRVRRVENGTPAVVVSVNVERGEVGLELAEPRRRPRRLVLSADAPLDLGYARHVVKAQGVTTGDTDLAVSRHTSHNELYVMATRARSGARLHAIAAELAEGLDVAPEKLQLALTPPVPAGATPVSEIEAELIRRRAAREAEERASHLYPAEMAALHGLSDHDGVPPPAGVVTVAELKDVIAAEGERRERDETVKQISRRAGRSSTKEAVGDRQTTEPAVECDAHRETRDDRTERAGSEREVYQPNVERRWERSLTLSRRDAPKVARGAVVPIGPRPPQRPVVALPANDPVESVARRYIETVGDRREAYEDILWSLINSTEFLSRR